MTNSDMAEWKGRKLNAEFSVEMGFPFPTIIGKNLTWWRHAVLNDDMDFCCIVDGKEGASKSHTAQQIAYFLDIDSYEDTGHKNPDTGEPLYRPTGRKLELGQIVFTKEDFKKAVRELPPYKAIVFDEASRETDRRKTFDNVDLMQMLREARAFNKFVVFVMQSFFDVDMFFSVWRTRALFHIYYNWDTENIKNVPLDHGISLSPLTRGYCRFYSESLKKDLYTDEWSRKKYYYKPLKGSFPVKFSFHWVIEHEKYKQKKLEAVERLQVDKTPLKNRSSCPGCGGGSFRYLHGKKEYICRTCPWRGQLPGSKNNFKDIKKKKEVTKK